MKKINQYIAILTFCYSFIIYLMTMAPTASFWDCGEFIATSVIMGVPHPPGSPLYLLLGNVFSQIPLFSDVGARVNLISPIVSALAVMFLYLIIVQLVEEWRGKVKNTSDAIIAYGGGFIGACTFAVTDSHWFNAVEAEVYAMSTFFTAIVVWLILRWSQNTEKTGNIRNILLISYMLGLASGVHLLNLLALPFIALIVYYKRFEFKLITFLLAGLTSVGIYLFIYQGMIKGLPTLAANYNLYIPIILVLIIFSIAIYSIIIKNKEYSTVFACIMLVFIGYTSYTTIFIRATQHPAINENNPDTIDRALSYLNRDQYGSWSITDRKQSLLNSSYISRWVDKRNLKNPTRDEVKNFVLDYQFKEMYFRYFAWQFIGRENSNNRSWDLTTKDGQYIKSLDGINWKQFIFPFAFIIGIGGLLHHFKKDWKKALAVLALFSATGVMIILYLNQYDPQPRERDYSYVGSFFAFSIWIGIGITGILERIRQYIKSNTVSVAFIALIFVLMPFMMLYANYHQHNRSGNYVAWDYAYNLLNSCEPNGIIFTNGDNDTFPLWYIQEVEGVRKDVRVVNLSLLNTDWYIHQLKNDFPKLPIQLDDQLIDRMGVYGPYIATVRALQSYTSTNSKYDLGEPFTDENNNKVYDIGEEYKDLNAWNNYRNKLNQASQKIYQANWDVRMGFDLVPWNQMDVKVKYNDNFISWKLNPTHGSFLRVQDFMIMQLINDLPIQRPIYFAVTVSPENRLGLDDYLQMEGLVFKLKSKKVGDEKLNHSKMIQNITETNNYNNIIYDGNQYSKYIESGNGVYRYRNLNNDKIYFNDNIHRLIQNYRSSFLQLGIETIYSERINKNKETLNLLNLMEQYFPSKILPMRNTELEIQVGRMYKEAGDSFKYTEVLNEILSKASTSLEDKYYIGQLFMQDLQDFDKAIEIYKDLNIDYPNQFEIVLALVQAYSQSNQLDKAVNLLENWISNNPNDPQALEYLNILKDIS